MADVDVSADGEVLAVGGPHGAGHRRGDDAGEPSRAPRLRRVMRVAPAPASVQR